MELIVKCDQRIADYKQSIAFHKSKENLTNVVDHYYTRWQITLAVKERLVKSYANMLSKIVKPTVEKILQTA